MVGEWHEAPLDELLEDILDRRGVTPLKLDSNFIPDGHRVISAKLIKDGQIDLSADVPRFVDTITYRRWMRTPLLPDDVILTSEAPLGETAYVKEELSWCLGQRLFALRTKKSRLTGRFLYYAFRSEAVRHGLQSRATGTTAQGIRQSELRKVLVPEPPLPVQRAIAHILGTLDDKIELNRRINETLEAITQAIFKSWFVDATEDGLPEGWRESTIGEVCEFAYGKSLKEEIRQPGSVPVYGSNGQVGWHNEALVKGPGIVIGRKGNPGIVTWSATDFFPIDTAFYVVPKDGCRSLYFLFHALHAHDLASLGADSAVPGLNRNLAYMSRQAIPPQRLLDAFDKQVCPIFDQIHRNAEESRTLAAIRDALLPKLLSGKIRMEDAGKLYG